MKLKAYIPEDWEAGFLENLERLLDDDIELVAGEEIPSPADYEIVVSGRPPRKVIEASPEMRYLLIPWAGLPVATSDLMREFPSLQVHNIHHNAFTAAEMAIALLLACAKRIVEADSGLRRGDWTIRYSNESSTLIEGSSALVLGFGEIGTRVARVLESMGAAVTGIARSVSGVETRSGFRVHCPERLHDLLPKTDILVLSLPLTSETRGIIGREELSLLHEASILVNVGRGHLVDEEALYDALSNGELGAAGIDVWFTYPPSAELRCSTYPSDKPFWDLPNVVMTPHMGGAFGVEELEARRARAIADSLNSLARTGSMPHRVDLARGY